MLLPSVGSKCKVGEDGGELIRVVKKILYGWNGDQTPFPLQNKQ